MGMNCEMKIVFHFVFLPLVSPEGAQASSPWHQAKRRILEQRPIVVSEMNKARKRSVRNGMRKAREGETESGRMGGGAKTSGRRVRM